MMWIGIFFDFIVAGVLLLGAGLTYELINKISTKKSYKVAGALAVGTGLILVWANLAVGIIGNEDHPINLVYTLMVLGGLLVVFLVRFRASKLALITLILAGIQILTPMIALIVWKPEINLGVIKVFILNLFFALLWLSASYLFKKSV